MNNSERSLGFETDRWEESDVDPSEDVGLPPEFDPDYVHLVMVGATELLREQGEALAAARKSAA